MGRPNCADEAGGIYHALNRDNARSTIFHKPEDYEAFEQILAEGLTRYARRIPAYQLMPIQDDDHFLWVCRYTERNALRAGLVRRA